MEVDEVPDHQVATRAQWLAARKALVCAPHAPIEKLAEYKRRMGWRTPYVSTYPGDFGYDFGVSFTPERRRQGAEYNFEPVDFDKVLEDFVGDQSMEETAPSIGIDVLERAPKGGDEDGDVG